MRNIIRKWDDGLGIRLPAEIAAKMQIKCGTPVILQIHNEVLEIRVAGKRRRQQSRFKLHELIEQMTPENIPPAYDWGPDVGTEIIEPV